MAVRYLIGIILLIGMPSQVWAHAALVKAVPGSRAVLSHMPGQIELCFNETVELKFSSMRVTGAQDAPVPLHELALGSTPKCVAAGVSPAGAGTYRVDYRVLSLDGHIVESSYQFTVKPEPAAPE